MHATDVHGSTGKAGRPLLFEATGFVLLAAAVAIAFHPPLGRVGFALVCVIVLGLATFAAVVFPRLRVSAQRPAEPPDSEKRLLVVADEHCGSPGLWKSIEARLAGAVAVHLVVPVRVSHLQSVTNDEASELRAAEDRAGLAVELLRRARRGRAFAARRIGPLPPLPAQLRVPRERERTETGPEMSLHPTPEQPSGTLEAEHLRRARLSVWEYEGGSLGPSGPPLEQRTEVVFDGVTILTSPGAVMTPRHTTEALVDWAVEWIGSRSVRVADVGTGSGAVAVAVALRAPGVRVWATDDSEAAIALARANVRRNSLGERVQVLLGDLLEPVPGRLDLVLANLPYHAAARSRGPAASACREQPEHAIYAPGDGLQFNRDLIDACRTRLQERGALAIQLYGQVLSAGRGELDQLLREIEARAAGGWEARVAADANGRGRRCCAWHSSPA